MGQNKRKNDRNVKRAGSQGRGGSKKHVKPKNNTLRTSQLKGNEAVPGQPTKVKGGHNYSRNKKVKR